MKQHITENLKLKNRSGFTLVELIVVMSIISILATLLFVNFIEVTKKGRDSTRKSDVQQIRTAIELYRSDYGVYPTDAELANCGSGYSIINPDDGRVYLETIPCDPKDPSADLPYEYVRTTDFSYNLNACMESVNDQDANIADVSAGTCTSERQYQTKQP